MKINNTKFPIYKVQMYNVQNDRLVWLKTKFIIRYSKLELVEF